MCCTRAGIRGHVLRQCVQHVCLRVSDCRARASLWQSKESSSFSASSPCFPRVFFRTFQVDSVFFLSFQVTLIFLSRFRRKEESSSREKKFFEGSSSSSSSITLSRSLSLPTALRQHQSPPHIRSFCPGDVCLSVPSYSQSFLFLESSREAVLSLNVFEGRYFSFHALLKERDREGVR